MSPLLSQKRHVGSAQSNVFRASKKNSFMSLSSRLFFVRCQQNKNHNSMNFSFFSVARVRSLQKSLCLPLILYLLSLFTSSDIFLLTIFSKKASCLVVWVCGCSHDVIDISQMTHRAAASKLLLWISLMKSFPHYRLSVNLNE